MEYADTQNNLGNTYRVIAIVKDKYRNCNLALTAYREALKVYTLDKLPEDYINTHINIGIIYSILAEVKDKAVNYEKAIQVYKETLKISTIEKYPKDKYLPSYLIYAKNGDNWDNGYNWVRTPIKWSV